VDQTGKIPVKSGKLASLLSLMLLLSAQLLKPVGLQRQEERNCVTSSFLKIDPLSHVTATAYFKP